jgi:hypothetical protein
MNDFKNGLAILFCLVCIPLGYAQSFGNDRVNYKNANFTRIEKDTVAAHYGIRLKKEDMYTLNSKKGKKTKEQTREIVFDSAGYILQDIIYNAKHKEVLKLVYIPDSVGHLQQHEIWQHGKKKYLTQRSFDSLGREKSYAFYKGENIEPTTLQRFEYDGKKLKNVWIYKDNSEKLAFVKSYFYLNDTGKLIESYVENNKGKRLYTWNYNCETYGTLSKKEAKKETRICTHKVELPNGHRQEIWEEARGVENYRYIYEYDSANRQVRCNVYHGKFGDKLDWRSETEYNQDTIETKLEVFYDKNAKLYYTSIELRVGGRPISNIYTWYKSNGKMSSVWETQNSYESGLLARTRSFNPRKPMSESVTEYAYSEAVKP